MPPKHTLPAVVIAAALLLASCSPSGDAQNPEPDAAFTPAATAAPLTPPATPTAAVPAGTPWTVSGPVSGNRVLETTGGIDLRSPVDISLSGTPLWIVGAPSPEGSVWIVALDDGRLEAWRNGRSGLVEVALNTTDLPPGTAPVTVTTADGVTVLMPPPDSSPLSYPLPIGGADLAYVTAAGLLVIQTDSERHEFDIAALPDTRLTQSSDGLLAVLADATTRYPHGVLGDDLEAGRILIVDPATPAIVGEAVIAAPAVIEGIAAMWADVDGNGEDEVLVTVSDAAAGAGLFVFDRDGSQIAAGPSIGRGNRWRNQLGVGPTGPDGEIEVVDVRVPHIGGVVEYFRIDGDELAFQTQLPGYTSHVFGSRNLDMALAADVTGDGAIEVVVPNQALTALGVLSRTADGVTVVAELALPGNLATNLAAGVNIDGQLSLAIGTTEGVLRVWPAGQRR